MTLDVLAAILLLSAAEVAGVLAWARLATSVDAALRPQLSTSWPVLLLLPLLALALRGGFGVELPTWPVAWAAAGGAAAPALAMLATAALVAPAQRPWQELRAGSFWAPAAALAVGITLLLVAAWGRLTVGVGQLCFAVAGVTLWINAPEASRRQARVESARQADVTAGAGGDRRSPSAWGVALAASAGVVSGGVILLSPSSALPWLAAAAVLGLLCRCMVLGWRLRSGGVPLACWTAALGVLLGIGLLSTARLVPSAWAGWRGEISGPRALVVALGTGPLMLEAMTVIGVGMAAGAAGLLPRRGARTFGAAVLVVALALLTWRVVGVAGVAGLSGAGP